MIVGTAGHIDHGKSTLVRALTGTDPSRLAEEKRRGITIELGYAFLDAPDGERIGFIDVPGHERLVHTMLAGATGIDAVMLVVAADDGVMPQTREHLAVVSLLGIRRGVVVVTKTDRVSPERVTLVMRDARTLLAAGPLADAPILPVAATDGLGLDALKAWLFDTCAAARAPAAESPAGTPATADAFPRAGFRLAVDRAFTLGGIGTVVTGTVFAGEVRTGDALRSAPGERSTRARSLHAQNRPTARAGRGQRCAINVASLARDDVERGDWLCAPAITLRTERIDVSLTLWHAEEQPLRSGAHVHLHAGAADVTARVVLLDGEPLAPGATRLAQLILQAPIAIWCADRVVLRDASASRTLAGGQVLDPFAPARYRKTPERLDLLRALRDGSTPETRLAALLSRAPHGVEWERWRRAEGLLVPSGAIDWNRFDATPIDGAAAAAAAARTASSAGSGPQWLIGNAARRALEHALEEAIARVHREEPDALGIDAARLRRLAAPRAAPAVVDAAIQRLLADERLARHGAFLHAPDHLVTLAPAEEALAAQIVPRLAQGGYDPPWVRDLARELTTPEAQVRQTLVRMAIRGQVFQVVRDLYYDAAVIERLAAIVRELANDGADERAAPDGTGGIRAAEFRDHTGLGRKRAIQILEFFDRIGLLRRVRDAHLLRPGSTLFGGGAPGVRESTDRSIAADEAADDR
ncbi:MAG: selenocysteine-specific translation elongation factor [Burkholderiaceae bacterium]